MKPRGLAWHRMKLMWAEWRLSTDLAVELLIWQVAHSTYNNTSVSETIRKPPLVKAQTAFKIKQKIKIKYGEKRFSIWRMELLYPAMWHVALESWQWIHQVAAPCNMIRGSGMTCHGIRPNVSRIGILHLVSILTISPQSTCHSAPVCEILSKSDHPQQKKWRHVDFQDSESQPSSMLGVQ